MHDLIVIGGGPAGAAAAITAQRRGARVLLLERGRYPRHKVCGEFVSPEALGLLRSLLADSGILDAAPRMHRARLFLDGSTFEAAIDPAAASIARFDLDAALWHAAAGCGVECQQQAEADAVTRTGRQFRIATSAGERAARTVIDASGRWSKLSRAAGPTDGWLGLKAHFAATQTQDSTDLYFFDGGYCGVQPVGAGRLNVCAMVRAGVACTLDEVFTRHPRLAEASRRWREMMAPLATSPLIFRPPTPVRGGILCAGDAAGFIDPFVGDGIALALRTGVMAAEILCQTAFDAEGAARGYRLEYERQVAPLFRAAARVRRLLTLPQTVRRPLLPLLRIPGVAEWIVKTTRAAA